MAAQEKPKAPEQEKWYFTKEQLQNSPSRRCGLDADKELAYRQQAANLIQDMGQRLQVSQLCINTAIVYMHRFYAFHSFTQFHRNAIAAAALFLAAKVEEQPRKLEYVIKVAHVCLHRGESVTALTSEQYQEQAQDLVFNENVLLQTLGFDVAIDHPHTHVVRTCHLVKAPKDLAQTSYFMASNSLHLTTMCLQYRPTVVACFCIHLASKWSNWAIPQSSEGRHWFSYVDRSVTSELLERLTAEFLHIFDKCPSRLKRKMMTMSNNSGGSPHSVAPHGSQPTSSTQHADKKHSLPSSDDFDKSFDREYEREKRRQPVPGGYVPAATAPPPQKIDYTAYREKKEREERERRQRTAPPPRPPSKHPWPHKQPHPTEHKTHEHKLHHKVDHRHHRPHPMPPTTSTTVPTVAAVAEPVRTRPPSLFSPENVTAPAQAANRRPAMPVKQNRPAPSSMLKEMQPPTALSPFSSPPIQAPPPVSTRPQPALVPVVKKLEESSYEMTRARAIETDPALVSNLLKESLARPAPITVHAEKPSPQKEIKKEPIPEPVVQLPPVVKPTPPPVVEPVAQPIVQPTKPPEEEHKHKKEKKKKDKHKHKERDKSKEERKKHKKDKERERKMEAPPNIPTDNADGIRITIPREKLESPGLKIKIPKERLTAPPPPPQSSSLKIKISKEVLETSRKRSGGPELGPPHKQQRQNGAPHKVGNWNLQPPPYRQQLPYYMVQPPPPLFYGMNNMGNMGNGMGMDGYFYGFGGYAPPMPPPPPLPNAPPPPVPPPPPE